MTASLERTTKDSRFGDALLLSRLSAVIRNCGHSEYLAARNAHFAIEQKDSDRLTEALRLLHGLRGGFGAWI